MANLEKFNKHNKMFNIFYSEIFAISVQSFLVPGLFLLCLPPGSRRPPIVGWILLYPDSKHWYLKKKLMNVSELVLKKKNF